MLLHRRIAKDYLKHQDRPTFLEIVYKSKVTPTQRDILYHDILDRMDHQDIGDIVGLTENSVNHEVGKAYDLIYHYISNTLF